jgi:hypothetical protein
MSWGLSGKTREIRQAEYYYEGEELKHRLIDINEDDAVERQYLHLDVDYEYEHIDAYTYDVKHAEIAYTDPQKLARARLDIEHKHGRLPAYDYDKQCVEFDVADDMARKIALLEVEFKHGKIDERKFELQRATLNEEPYIAVVKSEYDPRQGMNGLFFEFDWNDLWIEYLRLNGYVGVRDEDLIEQWFTDICRSVAEETPEQQPANVPFNSGRIIRQRREGGTTEYS